MGIRMKRLPSYGLTLDIWSGTTTSEQIIEHYAGLTPAEAGRRITFLDPTVDLSTTDVMSIPALKHTVAAKLRELYAERPTLSAVVCDPDMNRPVVDFWLRYAWGDSEHAPHPVSSLEEACDWLGLPVSAREAVAEAVRTRAP